MRSWNESWFFSCIDLDGGPAVFFRVGVMPNQARAMLWCFVNVDGEWLAVEESRLAFGDLDLSDGIAYDAWGSAVHVGATSRRSSAPASAAQGQVVVRTGPRGRRRRAVRARPHVHREQRRFRTGTGGRP